MRSSRWALVALTSTLGLVLTACPQNQNLDGPVGPEGEAPSQGAPPEMNTAAHPDDARWKVAEGEGVAIKGTLVYPGEAPTGAVRIDVLTQAGEAPPHLVSAETLDALGEFTIQAPKDFGEVHLVAFIDRAGDGPSPDDAAVASKVTIGAEDITGLVLTLSDEPDLGELTPGAPPTENGGPPAGAPPEGGPEGEQGAAGEPPGEPSKAPPGGAPDGDVGAPEGAQVPSPNDLPSDPADPPVR